MAKPYTIKKFSKEDYEKEWLEFRKSGLGGSDAASVLGYSPFKSTYELWAEKSQLIEPEDISNREAVEWGKRLEDVVAQKFADEHSELDIKNFTYCYVSNEYPFMFASLDRVATDADGNKYVVEIKTTNAFGDDWADGVPIYYEAQVYHYLAVTGFKGAYVACLTGGNKYQEYYITAQESVIDYTVECEKAFWQQVINGIEPALTPNGNDARALFLMHGDAGDTVVPADDNELIDQLAYDIAVLRAQIKSDEAKKKLLENNMRQIIGDNRGIMSDVYRILWTRSETSTFDKKQFEQDYPELAEKYTFKKPKDMGIKIKEIK